jgi:hypothetical protein
MLHVPHVVEEKFSVAHGAIREGTGTGNPGFCHSSHHCVQFLAAVLDVAEQYVLAAGGLRHDDVVFQFAEAERWWWVKLSFAFCGEIQVEEEDGVISQISEREPPLTVPHGFRAGLNRVAEHVDCGMELLPDCGSPKIDHESQTPATQTPRTLRL